MNAKVNHFPSLLTHPTKNLSHFCELPSSSAQRSVRPRLVLQFEKGLERPAKLGLATSW